MRLLLVDRCVLLCLPTALQYGEPGPRPAANHLQGADAACLRIRSLTLLPQGSTAVATRAAAGHTATSATAASRPGETSAASVSSMQTGAGSGPGSTSAALAASAAAAATPEAVALAAAASEGQLSWSQMLLQLPQLLHQACRLATTPTTVSYSSVVV